MMSIGKFTHSDMRSTHRISGHNVTADLHRVGNETLIRRRHANDTFTPYVLKLTMCRPSPIGLSFQLF